MTVLDHETRRQKREHRRRRIRRHGRRAYVRSVYFLPSLATLGNAVCGFGAMYVSSLADTALVIKDPWTAWWARHAFMYAAYLIFIAMIFDALDGRLARLTRHTTDFGGQLDSLADAVSFGAAPAFIALQLFHFEVPNAHVAPCRVQSPGGERSPARTTKRPHVRNVGRYMANPWRFSP